MCALHWSMSALTIPLSEGTVVLFALATVFLEQIQIQFHSVLSAHSNRDTTNDDANVVYIPSFYELTFNLHTENISNREAVAIKYL